MKRKICVNGSSLNGKTTGIERYVTEILKRLDMLLPEQEFDIEVIYPRESEAYIPDFQHIRKVPLAVKGKKLGVLTVKRYLYEHPATYCSLSGNFCVQNDSIIVIHDIRPFAHNEYDPLSFRLRCSANFLSAKMWAAQLVTDSQTSKQEICESLHISPDRVAVISNGWEHMQTVSSDMSIFERHAEIERGNYFYSLSSQAPHKNFKFVWENAKSHPNLQFVIAGKAWPGESNNVNLPDNVVYLGYISDGESKALMKHCRGFIHPSKYEGFGITPLEALACGAPLYLAEASCLPEIYGDCATFFDPDDYMFNFERSELHKKNKDLVLKKYSWHMAASKWVDLLTRYYKL